MKAIRNSAAGAEQLSSAELIPDSRAIAGQGVKNEGEPSAALSIQSSGAVINRRSAMNLFVGAALTGTALTDVATPASAGVTIQASDPVFSLIEKHRRAMVDYSDALLELPDGSLSPDPVREVIYGDQERAACSELTNTSPHTLPGLFALLSYVEGTSDGRYTPSGKGDGAFDDQLNDIVVAARECLGSHLTPAARSQIADWLARPVGRSVQAAPERQRISDDLSIPEYPWEIFGTVPEGFVLERTQRGIGELCVWHRNAMDVVDRLNGGASDYEMDTYCEIKNRIFRAILSARPSTPAHVAMQLRAVVAEAVQLDGGSEVGVSIEEVLDIEDIFKLSAGLTRVTGQITPKKSIGAFERDGKLTREGLLARYSYFLVEELQTVSWHLYGERDFAKHFVFYDRAVQDRCNSPDNCDSPFFDEKRLPDRACAVLGSLGIDTVTPA